MAVCECCGNQIKAAALKDEIANASPLLTSALEVLASRPGRFFTAFEIADHVYRHDQDGGPGNTSICINRLFFRHMGVIAMAGLSVATRKGPSGGYRLVKAEVAE